MALNQVVLMGNLTRDPELRYTDGNTAICKFGIALNEVWYDRSENKQERVHFFDCVAWARTAEKIDKHFRKGDQIVVIGSLQYDSWDDRDSGKKRSKVEVKVFSFTFTRGGTGDAPSDGGQRSGRQDDRGGGRRDSRGGGRQDDQPRDDRHDGRDPPRDGGRGGGQVAGIELDDIPFNWLLPLLSVLSAGAMAGAPFLA